MCQDCVIEENQLIKRLDAGDKALDAIERVRELHKPEAEGCECCDVPKCAECTSDYPCETIKALDGETDE